jgi:hypothetical protein
VSVFDKMRDTEREVSRFFQDLGVWWVYEYPMFLRDESDRPRVWAPDFFLPDLGFYFEVCGSKEFDYDYRRKIYELNNRDVVFLHLYEDEEKWKHFFVQRAREIHEKRNVKINLMIEKASSI